MIKLSFTNIKKILKSEINGKYCIEILFKLKENEKFNECWMGKMPNKETLEDIYWYGLSPDGKTAYNFSSFQDLAEANLFNGKNLFEVWNSIDILSINSCDPVEMISIYLNE